MSGSKSSAFDDGAVFTRGSTLRHVLVMTSTGAIGLVAIFFVDVVNLFYISLLGEQELAAAIGYASSMMFFTVSISIGFMIATTAVTARAIGSGKDLEARNIAGTSLVFTLVASVLLLFAIYPYLDFFLGLLGATGETRLKALHFMQIAVPSFPILSAAMCLSGLLRAKGDAKRAMYVTLSSAIAALILDPLLIFGFDLGLTGAAIAIIFIRVSFLMVALYGAHFVHRMIARPDFGGLKMMGSPFLVIAIPAILTQLATPVGNAYVTRAIATFGDDAVAGWAIVGRLMPLAFAAVFALSGAVGPILSQNLGARKFDRLNSTMWNSLLASLVYCVLVWSLLAFFWPQIAGLFQAGGDAASLVRFFCLFVAGSFVFNGALFVANAAFNNLGYPVLSTVFNWGRATIGIIPFVWVGKAWGPEGVLAGWGIGGIVFGALAMAVCFWSLKKLPEREEFQDGALPVAPTANSPFTSGRGASA